VYLEKNSGPLKSKGGMHGFRKTGGNRKNLKLGRDFVKQLKRKECAVGGKNGRKGGRQYAVGEKGVHGWGFGEKDTMDTQGKRIKGGGGGLGGDLFLEGGV